MRNSWLVLLLLGVLVCAANAEVRQDKNNLINFELPTGWISLEGSTRHFRHSQSKDIALNVETLTRPDSLTVEFFIDNLIGKLEYQNFKVLSQKRSKLNGHTTFQVTAEDQKRRFFIYTIFLGKVKVDLTLLGAKSVVPRYESQILELAKTVEKR